MFTAASGDLFGYKSTSISTNFEVLAFLLLLSGLLNIFKLQFMQEPENIPSKKECSLWKQGWFLSSWLGGFIANLYVDRSPFLLAHAMYLSSKIQGAKLQKHIDATLGSGNLREAVRLPPGEDMNEWLAVNGNHK